MPQPRRLHFVSGPVVPDLLYPDGLTMVPDAGASHGAHLRANPSLDLTDPGDRRQQLDDWLAQIALDSGLFGMDRLLAKYHGKQP